MIVTNCPSHSTTNHLNHPFIIIPAIPLPIIPVIPLPITPTIPWEELQKEVLIFFNDGQRSGIPNLCKQTACQIE